MKNFRILFIISIFLVMSLNALTQPYVSPGQRWVEQSSKYNWGAGTLIFYSDSLHFYDGSAWHLVPLTSEWNARFDTLQYYLLLSDTSQFAINILNRANQSDADSNFFRLDGTTLSPKTATKLEIDTIDLIRSYFNTSYIDYLVDSLYYNAIGSHVWNLNNVQKMWLNASYFYVNGKAGFGVASPDHKIHVQGTTLTDASIRAEATAANSSAYYMIDNDVGVWSMGIDGDVNDNFTISNATGLGAPKLIIDTSGNVGIGTSSPQARLNVHGDDADHMFKISSTTYSKDLLTIGGAGFVNLETGGTSSVPDFKIVDPDNSNARASLQIQGNGGAVESLFVTSSGNVGIGTTNPGAELEVNGTTGGKIQSTYNDGDGSATNYCYMQSESDGDMGLYASGDSTKIMKELVVKDTLLKDYVREYGGSQSSGAANLIQLSDGSGGFTSSSGFQLSGGNLNIIGGITLYSVAAFDNNDTDDTLIIATGYNAAQINNAIVADGFKFNSAKTYYYSVSPMDFKSINPYVDQITYDNTYVQADEDAVIFYAEVHLPHGATITSINIKSNVSDESYYLYRNDFAASSTQMATANFNTADNTISNATIDNANYSYSISTTSIDNTDRIYGGTITWTITEL